MWIYLESLWDIVCFYHLSSPFPAVAFTECVSLGLIESVKVALLAVFDGGRRWWNSQTTLHYSSQKSLAAQFAGGAWSATSYSLRGQSLLLLVARIAGSCS